MKLQKGNVFTSVCQEFCPQGGGVHPPRQTATAADGTHPTGMHSCSYSDDNRNSGGHGLKSVTCKQIFRMRIRFSCLFHLL